MAGVLEIVRGVEYIVAEELPNGPVNLIGTGLDARVENRRAGPAELGAEVRGLDLEFRNRVDRGKNHEVRSVQEVHGIGIVVDTVQHVIVLRRAIAIRRKGAVLGVTASVRLGGIHACGELGQEGEVAPIQREIVYAALVDDLAHRRIFGLQYRRGRSHFDSLAHGSGLELEIN